MKSKRSLCNKAIIQNDLHRFKGLLIGELILLQLLITLPTFANLGSGKALFADITGLSFVEYSDFTVSNIITFTALLNILGSPFLALILGAIVPLVIFSYLNKEKEAYTIHALPLNRTTLFFSHYVFGLKTLLLPIIITYIVMFVLSCGYHLHIPMTILYSFLCSIIEYTFFYHLGCLSMMLCGNNVIAIIVYTVLNGVLPVLQFLINSLNDIYICLSSFNKNPINTIISANPIHFFHRYASIRYINIINSDYSISDRFHLSYLGLIALTLIPSGVMLYLAIFAYKKRKIEAAGELMVFPWTKSVFRLVFTLCASFIAGTILGTLILDPVIRSKTYNQRFWYTAVLVLLLAIFFYVISNMILMKSFHVLKRTSWVRCSLTLVGIFAILLATKNTKFAYTIEKDCYTSIRFEDIYANNDEDGYITIPWTEIHSSNTTDENSEYDTFNEYDAYDEYDAYNQYDYDEYCEIASENLSQLIYLLESFAKEQQDLPSNYNDYASNISIDVSYPSNNYGNFVFYMSLTQSQSDALKDFLREYAY